MSLDNVKPGDKLTADAWNELMGFARAKSTVRGTNGLSVKNMPNGVFIQGQVYEKILAEIVCCGDCGQNEGCTEEDVQQARNTDKKCEPQNGDDECCQPKDVDGCILDQFDDNRYWCVFSTIDPAGFCDPVSTTMRDACADVKWKKVVATNLAEDNCQSHLLPPGTIVELSKGYTTSTPPQEVYWFTRTPMPSSDTVDECTDRSCDCPDSSSSVSSLSSSSQSQSSHSHSGCCDCITFVVNGGQHIDFHKTTEGTYQGQGYTLTWDKKWYVGGGAGAIAANAPGNRDCPPMDPSAYTLTSEGSIDAIHCCESSSSNSQSSHSHSKSGSESLPSGSSSNSQSKSNSNSNSVSQPSTPSNPPLSGSHSGSGSGQSQPPYTPSDSGSQKSTAIVPATFSPTGYTALYISEAPEVRFDDVVTAKVKQKNTLVPIDPKYLEVCEAETIQVYGFAADEPITLGAKVKGSNVELKFAAQSEDMLEIVIRLTGIRKGFKGVRFGDRTREQFERNEKFINSAY